ncbi:MAG TPA: hypothetical protein EYH08_03575 [Pyrodictium sp.]|nr:hypothetical protein [Pyrodictium sp.]
MFLGTWPRNVCSSSARYEKRDIIYEVFQHELDRLKELLYILWRDVGTRDLLKRGSNIVNP